MMNPKLNVLLSAMAICASLAASAQKGGFMQLFEIKHGDQAWNKIQLTDEVFRDAKSTFGDIRVWNINPSGDTLEAPFFIEELTSETIKTNLVSKVIHQRFENGEFSFVLVLDANNEIPLSRKIELDFGDQNFHWSASIAGSQDMKTWERISDKNELVSIQNTHTSYSYTTLHFKPVQYLFLKVSFPCKSEPLLQDAEVSFFKTENKKKSEKLVDRFWQEEHTTHTEIYIDLHEEMLVNEVQLHFSDTHDFYRNLSIEYLSEVIETEKGPKELYANLTQGFATSAEPSHYSFSNVLTKKLKVQLHNYNDLPLHLDSAKVLASVFELTYRGVGNGAYYLAFDNASATKPTYDLVAFKKNIPEQINQAQLGKQLIIEADSNKENDAPSNWLLWAIIIPAVLLMGWFSVKMMRSENS
jgi:hypothetical protein